MTPEEWLPVPFNPRYSVSDRGRVRGPSGKVLAPKSNGNDYWRVTLCDGHGGQREEYLHRLVALCFKGDPPEPHWHADHGNKRRSDNSAGNVDWRSPEDNRASRVFARGEDNAQSKLTNREAGEVRILASRGLLHEEIAIIFEISRTQISSIIRQESYL